MTLQCFCQRNMSFQDFGKRMWILRFWQKCLNSKILAEMCVLSNLCEFWRRKRGLFSTRPLCPDRHKRRELVTLLLRSLWRRLVKSSVPLKHRDFHQNDKVLASYHNIWKLDYRGLCGIVFSWEFISCFSTLVVSFKFGLCEKQWLSDNILSWWFCVFWGTRGVDEVLILWWFCRNLGVPPDPPWRPHIACQRNVTLQFHFIRRQPKIVLPETLEIAP